MVSVIVEVGDDVDGVVGYNFSISTINSLMMCMYVSVSTLTIIMMMIEQQHWIIITHTPGLKIQICMYACSTEQTRERRKKKEEEGKERFDIENKQT